MTSRCLLFVLLPAALLFAAPASASTVFGPSGLNFAITAGAGETNTMTVTFLPAADAVADAWRVHDTTSAVTCDAGYVACQQVDANTVVATAQSTPSVTTGNGNSSVTVIEEGLPFGNTTIITGGSGNDTLTAVGMQGDQIRGGGGNDTIDGGAQGDDLSGEGGNDIVRGGPGADVLNTTAGDGADVLDGNGGVDATSYASRTAAISVTEDGAANDGQAGEGDNVSGVETVIGTSYGDTIALSGSTGGGQVLGGAGNDTITGSAGADSLLDGGGGADAIAGAGGGDVILGGSGADTIAGGPGNDLISAGSGNDSVDGGAGNDDFRSVNGIQGGLASGDGADTWKGGAGFDDISYDADDGPLAISQDGLANDGEAGEGDNVGADIERIAGTTEADVITGGPADNVIDGNGGPDTLSGGDGNDTLTEGCCAQNVTDGVMHGGNGGDTLVGSPGDDLMDGGPGDDVMNGSGGADVYDGGDGVDTASFSFLSSGVTITPDGVADDGMPGDGANVKPNVENFVGTSGVDTISGAPGVANLIQGNGGGDLIKVASSPADPDTVSCGLAAFVSRSAFAPGVGANDVVVADARDSVSRAGASGCATVHRTRAPAPKVDVGLDAVKADGGVFTVPLRCVAATPSCRVTVQVSSAKGTILGVAHGVISAGKNAQFLFRLSAMRRALVAKGRVLHLRLLVETTDSSGRTTTLHRRLAVAQG